MLKNTKTEHVSNIVEISGAAIIAGSSFNFLQISGNIEPKLLDIIIVTTSVSPTTTASCKSLY